MPGQGGRSFDIIRQIAGNVINIFNKRPSICTPPCDGVVLQMHYKWTFWILLGGFSAIWYSWFHRDVITCVSHYNADTQVRLDYINICLSYPYVTEGDEKKYLLFYRWIHWVLLVLAGIYYIPRKISKNGENPKIKKLFEDLAGGVHRYDNYEKEMVERAARYVTANLRTHDNIFYKYIFCNIIALIIDIFTMCILDYLFQYRFVSLGYRAFPFNRDPRNFTDYLSQTFPPFADCQLTETTELTNKRTEKLGCHLTVMELYEKLFLALWLWLIVLILITICYLIYLTFFWNFKARLFILKVAKPSNYKSCSIRGTIQDAIEKCRIGDVYLMYRLRKHFSHAKFLELMLKLADAKYSNEYLTSVSIESVNKVNQADLKYRRNQMKNTPNKYNDSMYKPNKGILVE